MKFKAIIFDLDGTLLDTLADIGNSMSTALASMGFATHPLAKYKYFVGNGMKILATRALPPDKLDDETVSKCVEAARSQYTKRWAENTKPYAGIAELLTALGKMGIAKAVLSNKPDDFTKLIVNSMLGNWSFAAVQGATEDIAQKPDPGGALKIAADLAIPPAEFVFLGDTDTDMQTATAAGMYAAGALWGFRPEEELLANGAKTLAAKPQDILPLF